jgi:nucleotide-binding universal stress UspA family protein
MTDNDRPILVPVDFSDDSEAALLWAARLATCTGHSLMVLHIAHDPLGAPGRYSVNMEESGVIPIPDVALKMLADFLARMQTEHPDATALATAGTMVKGGVPRTRILEIADRVDACHIVMGGQGRSGLGSLLMGSKSERVVRLATVPVTIVKSVAFVTKEQAKKDKKKKKKEREREKEREKEKEKKKGGSGE